jgi:hypothetical protein
MRRERQREREREREIERERERDLYLGVHGVQAVASFKDRFQGLLDNRNIPSV